MNIEEQNLMYLMAMPDVFEEYRVTPTEYTTLESGKIFIHASKCGLMPIMASGDTRVVGFDNEGLQAYIEYVDGYATEVTNE